MRKILLLFAAIVCAAGMWAQMEGDKLAINHEEFNNVPQYFQNITYNAATQTLSFTDTYQSSVSMKRLYELHIYSRTALSDICALYSPWGKSPEQDQYNYSYGEWVDDGGHITFMELELTSISRSKRTYETPSATTGGTVNWNISEAIAACIAEGVTNIHISLSGAYYKNEKYLYYESSMEDLNYGYYEKNCLDINLPKVLTFEVSTPSDEVKYSETLQINCHIQAASNTLLTFLYYDVKESKYNEVYSYMLSAEEAQQGANVSYTKSFWDDDVEAQRTYMVRAYVDGSFQEAKELTINFKYPLSINSGNPSYYGAGETVYLAKQACMGYTARTTKDVPVVIEDMGDSYRLSMPACQLWLKTEATKYTVQFRDYDNTVLKTEKVLCGNDATPPTPPTHAGMTFNGWDKPYTNIHASQVIRARYSYDGVETLLTYSHEIAKPGDDVVFGMKVKTPSPVSAQATLQAAWLDDENDELNFGDIGYKYTYTAEEAAAGTSATKVLTVLPTGSLNYGHRARYFRMRVRLYGSSNDIYSNIIRIDTYYPVTISGEASAWSTLRDANGATIDASNGKELYVRPLDTIGAFTPVRSCPLEFQFFPSPAGNTIDAGNYWVVVPRGYGEGTLTITRHKHQVLFYCEGHFDGYWRTVYGDGVYEPQEVSCGGAATPPDVVAEVPEGKLFRGWKARGEYADDAYTCVKQDMAFDALLEDEPEGIEQIPVPQDKARKYMIDGTIFIALPDGKVYNIRGMRVR